MQGLGVEAELLLPHRQQVVDEDIAPAARVRTSALPPGRSSATAAPHLPRLSRWKLAPGGSQPSWADG